MSSPLAALVIGLLVLSAGVAAAPTDSVTDGFVGPVHTAVIETARVVPAQVRWRQAFGARAQVTEWLPRVEMAVHLHCLRCYGQLDEADQSKVGYYTWQLKL